MDDKKLAVAKGNRTHQLSKLHKGNICVDIWFPCLIVLVLCFESGNNGKGLSQPRHRLENWTRAPVLIGDLTDLNSGGLTSQIRCRDLINEVIWFVESTRSKTINYPTTLSIPSYYVPLYFD